MTAEIISVGTELLLGDIVDTNAQALGKAFARHGIGHRHRQTVGDNLDRLADALRLALSRCDLVVTIGGLGPTEDDLTRDGIALALEDELVMDQEIGDRLQAAFRARNLPWLDSQLRQAMRPSCGEAIANPNGTAPGLVCRKNGKTVVAMPGPRNEFLPMLDGPVAGILAELGGGSLILSRTLRASGIGESMLEERLRPLMKSENPTLAPYAKTGEVHLRLTVQAGSSEAAKAMLDEAEAQVRSELGSLIYGVGDETLALAVIRELTERGKTLAVAESCTGGGLGAFLTSVPGSSSAFLGGVISYANEAKTALLGVSPATLSEHGAVSEQCACEMAEGARQRLGSDFALSITGVAGPDGGTSEKPVGLVYIGLASAAGVKAVKNQFVGGREAVRERSRMAALTLLRRELAAR